MTTSQEEWRRPAAALGRLVCARGLSRVAGCPPLAVTRRVIRPEGRERFRRKGGQILAAREEDWLAAWSGPPNRTGAKSIGSTPPWRPVRYRAPEAIEGSFRQTDPGEILPGFVRRCPRFLHLLPFQSAYVHPRAGCRRQTSRQRQGVSLRRWRLDWRGGNRWSLR